MATDTLPSMVFLLASPRTGSTLLRVMLQGHSALFSPPELNLLPFTSMDERNRKLAPAAQAWMNCDQRVGLTEAVMALMEIDAERSAAWIRQFEEGRASTETMYRALRTLSAPRRLVDKSTLNASSPTVVERSLSIDPGAKFIHLVRHPLAAIESLMRMYFADCDPQQATHFSEQLWTLPNQNIVGFCRGIPRESYLRLRYEDLVAEPDAVMHEICSFLEIPFEDALLRPYSGARMTEGSTGNFPSLGDPNFHMHREIDASLGMVGEAIHLPRQLASATVELARQLCYHLPGEGTKEACGWSGMARSKHDRLRQQPIPKSASGQVILVVPPYTYRAQAYLDAADALGLEAVCAVDPNRGTMLSAKARSVLEISFGHPASAVRTLVQYGRTHRVSAVVSVDDGGGEIAALTGQALGFPHNSIGAIEASNDKYVMRQKLNRAGVASPNFEIYRICENPRRIAQDVSYPVVLKPLHLSGSRGVIRADDPDQFTAAFARLRSILQKPGTGPDPKRIMLEDYIPGDEVSLEGILLDGKLEVLAIYDKPDPLTGPFFEETIFITPSRMPKDVQGEIIACAQDALRAVELRVGPVQVELRVNEHGPWIVELAARTMGGYCSRALPFEGGASLEQMVLSRAAGLPDRTFTVRSGAHGVMMIPTPGDGVFRDVRGVEKAALVPGVTGVMISVPPNTRIERLPEGDKYVGFIFAGGESPELVERALREAHPKLEFQIDAVPPAAIATSQSKSASHNKQMITMQFDAVADGCRHATRMMQGTGRAAALYDPDALADIPVSSTSSALGCGDPAAAANYKLGETVVDLGSGGGTDCILAARAVGATGRVVGVDLSASMIAMARRSRSQLGLSNLEFFQGEAEHLPMQDASADVVISNNTINLAADKDAVFAEMYRVLKPGGRFVLCDVTIDSGLPSQVRSQVFARAGCINGALEQRDMREKLLRAGFADVRLDQIQPLDDENFAGLNCTRVLGVKPKGRRRTSQTDWPHHGATVS